MEVAVVQGERRQPGGRHANERLRRRGLVPAVIYGHRQAPETVALSRHDLLLAIEHARHVIKLVIDGVEQQYLLKDVQYDHLQQTPIHADLMRVDPEERVAVKVALELRGEPKGLHEGGELIQLLTELEVECPLLKIPEVLRPRIDHLGVGESLHVRDIELPEGIVARNHPDDVVATVHLRRGVTVEAEEEAAEVAEAAAEPEVIGRADKEQEGADEKQR